MGRAIFRHVVTAKKDHQCMASFWCIEEGDQCYAMVMGLNDYPAGGVACDLYKPAGGG